MIKEVEAAIIARLKEKIPSLKDVSSYQGEDIVAAISEQALDMPSVTIVFTGGPWRSLATDTYKKEGTFQLLIASENHRNEEARRLGGSDGELGSYAILEQVELALIGQDFDLEIEPMEPKESVNLWTSELGDAGFSVWGFEITTSWTVNTVEEDGEDLTQMHGDYKLDGSAEGSDAADTLEW